MLSISNPLSAGAVSYYVNDDPSKSQGAYFGQAVENAAPPLGQTEVARYGSGFEDCAA